MWGLISDVHGNLAALERALELLHAQRATKLAFLGDYLGRGDPDSCVKLIREQADVALVGNRDLDWQDRVSADSKAWVLSLPRTAAVDGLLLAHGDSRLTPALSTAQIGREFVRTCAEMAAHHAQVFAFGHSHHARIWRKHETSGVTERLDGTDVRLERPWRYFVNVGTTGLPFPGKGGASVALIDLERGRIRQLPLCDG